MAKVLFNYVTGDVQLIWARPTILVGGFMHPRMMMHLVKKNGSDDAVR